MSGGEAVDYGLIDKVLERRPPVVKAKEAGE
jgi:ATP-dependent protease ClpP protease subunit